MVSDAEVGTAGDDVVVETAAGAPSGLVIAAFFISVITQSGNGNGRR